MAKAGPHIIPDTFREKKAIVCTDLIVERCGILKLELLVPLSRTGTSPALERVYPRRIEADLWQVEADGFIPYILAVIHTGRHIERSSFPCFGVTHA